MSTIFADKAILSLEKQAYRVNTGKKYKNHRIYLLLDLWGFKNKYQDNKMHILVELKTTTTTTISLNICISQLSEETSSTRQTKIRRAMTKNNRMKNSTQLNQALWNKQTFGHCFALCSRLPQTKHGFLRLAEVQFTAACPSSPQL